MPVETQLLEDGHVSYFKINDPWTLEELFQGFAQATALRDSIQQKFPNRRVHSLIDLMLTEIEPAASLWALAHVDRQVSRVDTTRRPGCSCFCARRVFRRIQSLGFLVFMR